MNLKVSGINTKFMTRQASETCKRVAVIGGGAAGLFLGAVCQSDEVSVDIYDKNTVFGRKLRITGKGRCNVTNNCTGDEFFANVPTNPKFLYSAYANFDSASVMEFFENAGVPLKTERGNRVFPVSDRAHDIADALIKKCRQNGVTLITDKVKKIEKTADGFAVYGSQKKLYDFVVIATGGASYKATGSTGDGYEFARHFGHTVTEPTPSLVPLVCAEKYCAELMGLSLKNVEVKYVDSANGKTVYREFGEMLFTHFGVSGPVVLSASASLRPMEKKRYKMYIDLKPALDESELDRRLLSDFSKNINRNFSNSLSALLPQKLIPVTVRLSGIDPYKKVNEITKKERKALLELLKAFPLTVDGFSDINEAIITSGGISVKEINQKTMESKLVKGLYFVGEVLDCDAYTGGFNLQIAFSTAYAAASALINEGEK